MAGCLAGAVLQVVPAGIRNFFSVPVQIGGVDVTAMGMVVSFFTFFLLLAPEVSQVASLGFTRFIDSVFFPGAREKKPPYTLKVARYYVENRRWAEAEEEYARMVGFYPEQAEAWVERLALAGKLGEEEEQRAQAELVLAMALRVLKSPAERDAVYAAFSAATAR